MIANIKLLTDTLLNIKNIIFESFSITSNSKYKKFYNLLNQRLSKLYQVLIINQNEEIHTIKDNLKSLLMFDNTDLLGIFETINIAPSVEDIQIIINDYNN
jgi:hypothetical protein